MPIVVRCGGCGASLRFRDQALGKRAKCAKCKTVLEVRPEGETPEIGESDDAGSVQILVDPGLTVASQGKRRRTRPDPRPRPTRTNGSTAGENVQPDEQILLGGSARVRIVVLVLLLTPVVFASGLEIPQRLVACSVPLMLTGTFRTSKTRGDWFTTRLHVAFFPVTSSRCNLRGVSFIKAKYGHDGSGFGTFLMFGPMQVIFGRLFDFLMPAIGGPYQIHLVTAKGRELVAWRGSGEEKFRSMLDLLLGLTNAELRSM